MQNEQSNISSNKKPFEKKSKFKIISVEAIQQKDKQNEQSNISSNKKPFEKKSKFKIISVESKNPTKEDLIAKLSVQKDLRTYVLLKNTIKKL